MKGNQTSFMAHADVVILEQLVSMVTPFTSVMMTSSNYDKKIGLFHFKPYMGIDKLFQGGLRHQGVFVHCSDFPRRKGVIRGFQGNLCCDPWKSQEVDFSDSKVYRKLYFIYICARVLRHSPILWCYSIMFVFSLQCISFYFNS